MIELSVDELRRYQRQMQLPQLGKAGQLRLKNASVLVVGLGGLGAPAALYLVAAGVGRVGLMDGDVVDLSNLHRQILYRESDIGLPKVRSAAEFLRTQNTGVELIEHPQFLDADNAEALLSSYDLVVDGSDNFHTRYLVNDWCVRLGKPLIYGSVYRFEGQVSVFACEGGPCYRCQFPVQPPPERAPNCAESGVLGILPGVIGNLQASEAIKVITGIGEPLVGKLLHYDALNTEFYRVSMKRRRDCPACGDNADQNRPVMAEPPLCVSLFAEPSPCLSPIALRDLIAADDVVLVDVRADYERDICRIHGSMHWLADGEASIPDALLQAQKTIVVYCKSGPRSRKAQARLERSGVQNVYHLDGGILAWIRDVDSGLSSY